ncbi:MAG: dipeptide ABC transporter ATP-binding protein [Deltaproteobacteria bacterium]|nr:dipeptide ABC transporter ATP-binding protein [Deltaproteobacteria bacterium]
MSNLLDVYKLSKHFPVRSGLFRRKKTYVYAVDEISFSVGRNETLGLVGESGCGKSTLARTILHLLSPTSGQVSFKGKNLFEMHSRERQKLRQGIQMIFQDPFGSLNPRLTVERIVEEPLLTHGADGRSARMKRVKEMLSTVGLLPEHMKRFPHEFSGGQRQRIMLARALVLKPEMIIADEPVSALDVSVQAQMLNLLNRLQKQFGLSYIFVSHDLGVIRHVSHRVAVMYLGEIVELAPVTSLYTNPLHPYTRSLLSSIPIPDPHQKNRKKTILQGDVPSPLNSPPGCRLHTRCPECMDICIEEKPPARLMEDRHIVSCHLYSTGELWSPPAPER